MNKMFFVQPLVVNTASTTEKTKVLKVWLYQYERSVLDDEFATQSFFEVLKEKVNQLNKLYPRSKPLRVHKYSFPRHHHWHFTVRYADDDKDLFVVHLDQIYNIYFNLSI